MLGLLFIDPFELPDCQRAPADLTGGKMAVKENYTFVFNESYLWVGWTTSGCWECASSIPRAAVRDARDVT